MGSGENAYPLLQPNYHREKRENNPANSSYTLELTKYLIAPFTKKNTTKQFMKSPPKNSPKCS